MTDKLDNLDIIKRLQKDREGLIKQGNELKRDIVELQKRFLMVQGALKYVSQILEDKHDSQKGI